jgi:hypothetical protein
MRIECRFVCWPYILERDCRSCDEYGEKQSLSTGQRVTANVVIAVAGCVALGNLCSRIYQQSTSSKLRNGWTGCLKLENHCLGYTLGHLWKHSTRCPSLCISDHHSRTLPLHNIQQKYSLHSQSIPRFVQYILTNSDDFYFSCIR